MKEYKGSCLCGEVNYTYTGEINDYGYCHCSLCRKASGSAHSANAEVLEDSFAIEDNKKYLKEYESSLGTHRFFCSNCGSPMFSKIDSTPGLIRIRLGALDTDFDKEAIRHTFVKDKAHWDKIEGDIPQFDQWA